MTTPTTSTDLSTLVEALKREVAVPGEFDEIFPSTSDDDLAATLADAAAESQLDGFLPKSVIDPDAGTISPALSSGAGALIVLYAGIRIIRAQIRNLQNVFRVEAGSAKYEAETSATILSTELKDMQDRKKNLLALVLRQQRAGQSVYVTDGYLVRAFGYFPQGLYGAPGEFLPGELSTSGSLYSLGGF